MEMQQKHTAMQFGSLNSVLNMAIVWVHVEHFSLKAGSIPMGIRERFPQSQIQFLSSDEIVITDL